MHVILAQVMDLGHSYIHTRFHSLILSTSGGNSGLKFIHKMGPCISNDLWPPVTSIGHDFVLETSRCSEKHNSVCFVVLNNLNLAKN